jgi:hygromycin-B 4-O-kinase
MSTRKTVFDADAALRFLQERFDDRVSAVEFIHGGETAQAFSFTSGNGAFVLRMHTDPEQFAKDRFAHEHFASAGVPIPRTVDLGSVDERFCFAITERASGQVLSQFDDTTTAALLPRFMDVLAAIHSTDVARYAGSGDWDPAGQGRFESWRGYLLSIGDDGWFGWSRMFRESFMEQEIFDKVHGRIVELAEYCPEERYLVHGDYGFHNVLSDGSAITGVIDWGESKFGDFLSDIAFLDFWDPARGFGRIFRERCHSAGTPIPYYAERLRCYQLHSGLLSLYFWSMSNQKSRYAETRARILTVLDASGRGDTE